MTVQVAPASTTTRSAGAPSTSPRAAPRRPGRAAEDPGRAGRERLDRPGQGQPARADGREEHPERRLDAADPVRGEAELGLLVDLGVRGVVGRDRVGRPVDEGRQARRPRPRRSAAAG